MKLTVLTLKLWSLEKSLAPELLPDPPDLEDRDEKSSRFFLATPDGPDGFGDAEADVGAVVLSPMPWSVDEELCLEGER